MKVLVGNQQMQVVPLNFVHIITIESGCVIHSVTTHDENNSTYFVISERDTERLKRRKSYDQND